MNLFLAAIMVIAGSTLVVIALTQSNSGDGSAHQASAPVLSSVARSQLPPIRTPFARRQLLPLRTPFVRNGVRYAVFDSPRQPWTIAAGKRSPGAGRRWRFVSLLIHTITRPGVRLSSLHFRIQDRGGSTYLPDRRIGTASVTAIPSNRQTRAELGFSVPSGARALRFMFEPARGKGADFVLG